MSPVAEFVGVYYPEKGVGGNKKSRVEMLEGRVGGRQGRPGGGSKSARAVEVARFKRLVEDRRPTLMRESMSISATNRQFYQAILKPSKRPPVLTTAILKCIHRPELPFSLSWLMDALRSRKIKTTPKCVQTRLTHLVKTGVMKVVRVGRGGRQAHRPTSYILVKGGGW